MTFENLPLEYLLLLSSACQPALIDVDRAVRRDVDGLGRPRPDPLGASTSAAVHPRSCWRLWDVSQQQPVDPVPSWFSLQLAAFPPLPHQAGTRLGQHRPGRGPPLWTGSLHRALLGPVYRPRPVSGWRSRRVCGGSIQDVSRNHVPAWLHGQSSCTQESE